MPENPTLLQLAQSSARHYEERAKFFERMSNELADALWEIVVALQIPPQRIEDLPPGTKVVFGMYAVDRIMEALRAQAQGGEQGGAPVDPAGESAPAGSDPPEERTDQGHA